MDENQRFPPMVNLQQCLCEQLLADRAAAVELIDIRWQTKLAGLERNGDGVTLELETRDGPYRLNADWLVACDGARSMVRLEAMGLRFSGSTYDGTYIIVDILLRSDSPTERRAWFDPPTNPGSTILMHRQPRDIWRVDYQLRDDEDPEEAVKPENVFPTRAQPPGMDRRAGRLAAGVDQRLPRELPHALLTATITDECCSPAMPRISCRSSACGMNSGLDDTHNLAWKLAWVAEGRAPERLLDSYSTERVFAARENIRHASKSTEFMAPSSKAFELMREATLGLATKDPFFATLINPRQTSAITFAQYRR